MSFTSCSESNNDTMEEPQEELESGSADLTINGVGFNNFKVTLTRANVIEDEGSIRLDITNSEGYRIVFTVASPVLQQEYTMIDYNNTMDNISSMSIPEEGIFLSIAGGTLNITSITENGNATTYLASFNVDYDRQNNSPGNINVSGTFEIKTITSN